MHPQQRKRRLFFFKGCSFENNQFVFKNFLPLFKENQQLFPVRKLYKNCTKVAKIINMNYNIVININMNLRESLMKLGTIRRWCITAEKWLMGTPPSNPRKEMLKTWNSTCKFRGTWWKKKNPTEDVNNCGAGEIHLTTSRNSLVLFTIEFKTLCHSESADGFHRSYKKNSLWGSWINHRTRKSPNC